MSQRSGCLVLSYKVVLRLLAAGMLLSPAMIGPEILDKIPSLLAHGRYFPNGDHGIQPLATHAGLRRFMTLLHEVCGNPEGTFPRW